MRVCKLCINLLVDFTNKSFKRKKYIYFLSIKKQVFQKIQIGWMKIECNWAIH